MRRGERRRMSRVATKVAFLAVMTALVLAGTLSLNDIIWT